MAVRSRLTRYRHRRFTRQAFIFFSLTIILILAILFFGLPFLVRSAAFLLDLRSANTPPPSTKTNLAPPPPQLFPLKEATNSATISLQGFAQAGNEIILYQNNQELKSQVAPEDGNFTFSSLTLEKGENRFWAKAKTPKNQESQISNQLTIILDQDAPKLDISSPAPDAQFFGSAQKSLTLAGQTEPRSTLYINDHLIPLNDEGKFSSSYSLAEGQNLLNFKATDPAGNTTETTLTVTYSP